MSRLPAWLRPAYLLSFPERLLRAAAAALGGLLFELTQLLLPLWVRRSRLYQALVYRLLRLTVEMVGGVQGVFPAEKIAVGDLAVRKAVGNVVELLGFLAVGWSPLWVLAAASDLTGGTRAYLSAFVAVLKKDGLLPEEAQIQSVDELLNTLESSSSVAADLVDVPPLNVKDLAASWQALQENASGLPQPDQLAGLYRTLQQVAQREGRSPAELSALVAAGALKAGVQLGSHHVYEYYTQALDAILREGWAPYALRVTRPYLLASRSHFDPERRTYIEKALARLRTPPPSS